jgi:hypothetical protein
MPSLLQKYRPRTIEGIAGNRLAAQQLKRAVVGAEKAVLTGPPGCGKSLALQIIAAEARCELLDESPDDLLKASKQRSMWYSGKILVADLDMWDPQECLELLACPWPVIFTCGDIYERRLLAVRKTVKNVVRFKKVGWSDTVGFLEKACRQEGIFYDKESLGEMAKIADGDLRWCLLVLEGAGKVDAEFVAQLGKEKVQGIFDVLDDLFARRDASAGPEDMPWIVENLAECYQGTNLALAYSCIALADSFRGKPGDYFSSFLALLPRSSFRPQYRTPLWIGNGSAELKALASMTHCSAKKARSYNFLLEKK